MTKTLREHQQEAGRSRSERKVAAVLKNLEKAWAVKRANLSQNPQAIYQRERRARLKGLKHEQTKKPC